MFKTEIYDDTHLPILFGDRLKITNKKSKKETITPVFCKNGKAYIKFKDKEIKLGTKIDPSKYDVYVIEEDRPPEWVKELDQMWNLLDSMEENCLCMYWVTNNPVITNGLDDIRLKITRLKEFIND